MKINRYKNQFNVQVSENVCVLFTDVDLTMQHTTTLHMYDYPVCILFMEQSEEFRKEYAKYDS